MRNLMIALTATMALAACHHKKDSTMEGGNGGGGATAEPAKGGTLFVRLGGQPAIDAVVKDFVEEQVAKDARINAKYFANADLPHLEKMLSEQICAATGGGCTYTGKSMKESHTGMHVTDDAFTALVEDLTKSLDKFKVGATEKKELLGALGGMHDDIVGH